MTAKPRYSLIIPCFNEGRKMRLYDRCKVLFEYGVEVIFVNNGSLDNTATKLTALPKNDNLKIISLEENRLWRWYYCRP